jgi:hypothetical protein
VAIRHRSSARKRVEMSSDNEVALRLAGGSQFAVESVKFRYELLEMCVQSRIAQLRDSILPGLNQKYINAKNRVMRANVGVASPGRDPASQE